MASRTWSYELSLIDHFCQAVGPAIISPPQFVHWSALALVSAMVGRLTYTHTFVDPYNSRVYGNLFVGLVGPPGCGKTVAIREARNIAATLGVNIGPDDIYGEKIADILKSTPENDDDSPGTMALFLDEWNSLMHSGVASFTKQILCQLYDCVERYGRDTYKHGNQVVRDACLTLVGGCTPAHLHKFFTPLEWKEGLPSRLILVYGEKPALRANYRRGDMGSLLKEAEEVMQFISWTPKIGWTDDAMAAYTVWTEKGWMQKPPHSLLEGYMARRQISAAKLSMLYAVSECNERIQPMHFTRAVSTLEENEKGYAAALALAGGNDTRDIESFLQGWLEGREEVPEFAIRRILASRVPHAQIGQLIEELVAMRLLISVGGKVAPNRNFKGGKTD